MNHGPEQPDGGSSRRKVYREMAVAKYDAASEHLVNADPKRANNTLELASRYAILAGDIPLFGEICDLSAKANAVLDRLDDATSSAMLATRVFAQHPVLSGGRQHLQAAAELYEIWELSGHWQYAAKKFQLLADEISPNPGWETDLLARIANHGYSLAAKLRDPDLAKFAKKLGLPLLDKVSCEDERSAVLQWRAIYTAREGDPDKANELFQESLIYRATTALRNNTRAFPEAHMLVAQGRKNDGATMLENGIIAAQLHSMTRYVGAGMRLRVELGLI
jgi:hypothetical protein